MNRFSITATAIVFMMLSGCSSSSDVNAGNSYSKLNTPEKSFLYSSGGKSCMGGAAITGLTCLLTAGVDPNRLLACTAFAAAGCAVAFTGNYILDQIRNSYAKAEDQLEVAKKLVQVDYIKSQNLLKSTKETLVEDEKEIARIKRDIKDRGDQQDELDKKSEEMQKNLDFLYENLKTADVRLNGYKQAYSLISRENGVNQRIMKQRKSELEKQIVELTQVQDELLQSVKLYAERTSHVKFQVISFINYMSINQNL